MSVVIDNEKLAAQELGLHTFGHVLAHVHRSNRIVTRVLIDGQEPDPDRIGTLRQAPTDGHVIFVETTEPLVITREVLQAVRTELGEANTLSVEAGRLFTTGDLSAAFQKLSGCFGRWQHVQQSILKVAQLLRLDLDRLQVDGQPMARFIDGFGEQLRSMKTALEGRDFVTLSDVLTYEIPESTDRWHAALAAIEAVAC